MATDDKVLKSNHMSFLGMTNLLIVAFVLSGCGECGSKKWGIFGAIKECAEVTTETPIDNPAREVSLFYTSPNIAGSNSNLVVDSHGSIFYPNLNGYVIQKIDTNGVQTTFAGSGANAYTDGNGTSASFYAPYLLAIDSSDNIYVADGFKVRKITPNAIVTTLAAMVTGGTPRGISADSNGNVYFVWDDGLTLTHVIQKITSAGGVSVFAGSGTAGVANGTGLAAQFNYPRDLVTDSSGNIYVADTGNHLIRKITQGGVVTTFVGSGIQAIQNGVGLAASFYFYDSYAHMAIDNTDNIYIGDITGIDASRIAVIRKVTTDGIVTTYCGTQNWTKNTGLCSEVSAVSRFGVAASSSGVIYYVDTGGIFKIVN